VCSCPSETTYRLYSCRGCAEQVRICRDCDHGNVYCAGACAQICRRESLRRAGERFQLSYRGAGLHAARQRAWRKRQAQKVTHQGSPPSADTLIVAAISMQTARQGTHVDISSIHSPPQPQGMPRAGLRAIYTRAQGLWRTHRTSVSATCSFCWRALPPFARSGWLRSGP
jgi:hypothetical protein